MLARASKGVITVSDAVAVLGGDRAAAAKQLARWAEQGWLKRLRRGVYAPLQLDAAPSSKALTNPWAIVPTLFSPGYVGGWSAAEHWGLTEQVFRDVSVFTTRVFRSNHQQAEGTTFVVFRVDEQQLFGTKPVWEAGQKILVSDAHRTMVDMMARPETGGGIRHAADCLTAYLQSSIADGAKLIDYAERYGSGAVFKRLGFLLEKLGHHDALAAQCRARLSKGYARLDPALPKDRLVTRWRLWVPSCSKSANSRG